MAATNESTARTRRHQTSDARALLFADHASSRAQGRGGAAVGVADLELLESKNGMAVDSLRDRVGDMRHLALHIEQEVSEQNNFLDGMSGTFENAGGQLAQTMNALRRLTRSRSGGHMCALALFTAIFLVLVYLLLT